MKPVHAAALALALSACTAQQQAAVSSAQSDITAVCNVAVPLASALPSVGIYVTAACASEQVIAKLALDPSTLTWITGLYGQLKAAAGA